MNQKSSLVLTSNTKTSFTDSKPRAFDSKVLIFGGLFVLLTALLWTLAADAQTLVSAPSLVSASGRPTVCPIPEPLKRLELAVQVSHSGGVESVAFSPDSSLLATSGAEGVIKLWETRSHLLRREIQTGEGSFFGRAPQVMFTPSGRCVVSAGRSLKFWDVRTGRLLRSASLGKWAGSLAISPDGTTLAVGMYREVQLWHLVTPSEDEHGRAGRKEWDFQRIRSISRLPRHASFLSFSHNGLLALGLDGEVRVVRADTGALVATFDGTTTEGVETEIGKTSNAVAVAFAPDNSLLMLFGDMLVWKGGQKPVLTGFKNPGLTSTVSLAFSRDGKKLLLAGFELHVIDWPGLNLERTLKSDMPEPAAASISPDGNLIASGVDFNIYAAQLWNAGTGKLLATWEGRNGGVNDVAVSSDKRYLATATDDGPLRVWNLDSNRMAAVGNSEDGLSGVMFSPNNLLVSNNDGEVWNLKTGKLFRRYGDHVLPYAPKWPWAGSEKEKTFIGFGGSIEGYDVSPDGRLVAGAASDGNDETLNAVEIWDSASEKLLRRLSSENAAVRAVRFMPQGRLLAAGYEDGCIRFWNTQTWQLHRALSAHGAPINQLRLTSDGKHLLSAGNDYQVKIWNPKDGALKATLLILPPPREDEFSREWLLYTPQGLYDGSPGAEKFMRWRDGEKLLPASAGRKYRRENLLRKILTAS